MTPPKSVDDVERIVSLAFRKAKADLAQHELARRKGAFVEHSAVLEMLATRAAVFRKALRGTGRRLAPRLAGLTDVLEIRGLIEDALDDVLWEAYGKPPIELSGQRKKKQRAEQGRADDVAQVRLDRTT